MKGSEYRAYLQHGNLEIKSNSENRIEVRFLQFDVREVYYCAYFEYCLLAHGE